MAFVLMLDLTVGREEAPEPIESVTYVLRDEKGNLIGEAFDDLIDANRAARAILAKIGVYKMPGNVAMSFQGPFGWNGPKRKATTLVHNYEINPKRKKRAA